MDLDLSYPALSDLRTRCRRRIPRFVWDYVDSATGTEATKHRNRAALDAVLLEAPVLRGPVSPDLATEFLGTRHAVPFGIGPVGMSGLIWPGAEVALARLAADVGMPYGLSTVATQPPEVVGPHAGGRGWFQLYPPKDRGILRDMLERARGAGFGTLIFTVDVPGPSRRERQRRAQIAIPPRVTPGMLMQIARCPAWALGTLRHGTPRLRMMEDYLKVEGNAPSTAHAGYLLRAAPDWAYFETLRKEWDGPIVVKGVLRPDDARRLREAGADAVWVSNHGGRQFDAAPAAAAALPGVRAAVGPDFPVICDGGVEGGLDILRLLALGADFTMLGRGFHYALGAFGPRGAAHLVEILRADLEANMVQMALTRPAEVRDRLPAASG